MRYALMLLWILLCSMASAATQVSIGVALPGVSIGINLPAYPELVLVPGYPVYYAPRLNSNFFFYDGMYWVYAEDNWYASDWYNGPWQLVYPEYVPLFVLRIPVYYYRRPPVYFRWWQRDAPPRWGEHWGNNWERHHRGWDRWDRRAAPAPAPLPVYQRQYSAERYPQAEQQPALHKQQYRYQPRDAVVRQHYQQRKEHGASPSQQGSPRYQERLPSPQWRGEHPHGAAPQQQGPAVREQRPEPRQGAAQAGQAQQGTVIKSQGKGQVPKQRKGQGQEADHGREGGRAHWRNQ